MKVQVFDAVIEGNTVIYVSPKGNFRIKAEKIPEKELGNGEKVKFIWRDERLLIKNNEFLNERIAK